MMALLSLLMAAQGPLVFERVLDPTPGPAFTQPVDVTGRSGDDRLFVVELGGTVRVVRGGSVEAEPFLDVSAHLTVTGLAGLRAMTFHPDYEANGHVFIWYDAPGGSGGFDLVLARITRDAADPDAVDPATRVELLRVPQDVRGHGGGRIAFGPDGYLWLALGDGGLQNDPSCRAQDPNLLLGKMLRLDVDGALPYSIPPDNPYVGVAGFRAEIVHQGLRHPWKWSFDRLTGDLWIGDVGQQAREEVNVTAAGELGLNFGWPMMEGETCHASAGCPAGTLACGDGLLTLPAFAYAHDLGCSITGGFVYRGSALPELFGQYIATDYCSRRFWTVTETATGFSSVERSVEFRPAGVSPATTSSFGEDGDGELLLLDHVGGSLFRLVRGCQAVTTCPGEVNTLGQQSTLNFAGSTSIAANDVTIQLASLPPSAPALLFTGPETADVLVAGGRLCVGGQIARLGVRFAVQDGTAQFPLDWTAPPFQAGTMGSSSAVVPGATLTFQTWYRQPTASGGGANSNFTSAMTVTFCP